VCSSDRQSEHNESTDMKSDVSESEAARVEFVRNACARNKHWILGFEPLDF
jgi:hypothetical protein